GGVEGRGGVEAAGGVAIGLKRAPLAPLPLTLLAAGRKLVVGIVDMRGGGRRLHDHGRARLGGVLGPRLSIPPAKLWEPERVWVPARRHTELVVVHHTNVVASRSKRRTCCHRRVPPGNLQLSSETSGVDSVLSRSTFISYQRGKTQWLEGSSIS